MATIRRRKVATATVAIGYVRCSTSRQDNGHAAQAADLDRWAEKRGVQLVAVYIDVVSRTTDHGERPGLVAALDAMKAHDATMLVAQRFDRFAADAFIFEALRRDASKRDAKLVTTEDTGDEEADEDRRDFEALFSKKEIRRIRQRTKAALAVKKMRGERLGNVPFGFRATAPDANDVEHLEPNPDEQAIIERAKQLSDFGLSFRAITEQLNAAGFRTRKGTPFSHTLVHRFLQPLLIAEAA